MTESSIRAYAWIHFAASTMVQTSMAVKAVRTADELVAEFDKRFDANGEAIHPAAIDAFRERLETVERKLNGVPLDIEDRLNALDTEFESRLASLREGVASDLNALEGRLGSTDEDDE